MQINPIATLRQLKGSPLSVLIALTIVKPRHVSSSWLSGCTGYSHDAITAATWYLKEFGFIDCDSHRTNWRLAEGTQQLPLPVSMLPPEEPINPDAEKPHPSSTTTTAYNSKNNLMEGRSRSFNDRDAEKPQPDFFETCLLLLNQAGIMNPMAEQLCQMDHVNPDYLTSHINKAKSDGTQTGLLIHRIRCADPKPILPGSREDRDRYLICENCLSHPSKCSCIQEDPNAHQTQTK